MRKTTINRLAAGALAALALAGCGRGVAEAPRTVAAVRGQRIKLAYLRR